MTKGFWRWRKLFKWPKLSFKFQFFANSRHVLEILSPLIQEMDATPRDHVVMFCYFQPAEHSGLHVTICKQTWKSAKVSRENSILTLSAFGHVRICKCDRPSQIFGQTLKIPILGFQVKFWTWNVITEQSIHHRFSHKKSREIQQVS